jgi:PAS domain S-box-containing protein
MINFKRKKPRSAKTFFSPRSFLYLLGICLVLISFLFWKTEESRNLKRLHSQTETKAKSYSREIEFKYNSIYSALNRLAYWGIPNFTEVTDEWTKTAAFFIASFQGIRGIAWVDKSFIIQKIVPIQYASVFENRKANDMALDPSEVSLWVPVYNGTNFEGFILGIVGIDAIIYPVINDVKNDYMLLLSNEGGTVFVSANWKQPKEKDVFYHTITLQNTMVLNLSFAPTDGYLNSEILNSLKTLLLSLSFSIFSFFALYFAWRYKALSQLNESRFRVLLEGVQLVAVTLDGGGRISFCNDYLLALTGWKRDEAMGQDWFTRFEDGDRNEAREEFLSSLSNGTISARRESTIATRTGERRWIMLNNTILRDTGGNAIGIASIGEDITDRKRTESRINEQLAELQRWQYAMLGRESRILDLKREVNVLLGKADRPPRYRSAESQDEKEE